MPRARRSSSPTTQAESGASSPRQGDSSGTEPQLAFPKRKRIQDPELLAEIRKLPCIACLTTIGVEAHHVTTVGAGGDDVPENVMPLCFPHHRGGNDSWHRDPGRFIRKFPSVRYWLEAAERWDILGLADGL